MFHLVIRTPLITPCEMSTYVIVGIDRLLLYAVTVSCQSQWPCGLRRGSAAARLLGLRVRIGREHGVSVVCCQVEVSATGRSFVQRSPTEYGVSECDLETSAMRRPSPLGLPSHKKDN
jgi:hypothetical protein